MRKLILGVALALIAASCGGFSQGFEVKGNGEMARGAFDISLNYTSLSVDRGIKVVLVASGRGEGFIAADEEVLGHVSITEENGRVRVTYAPHNIIVKSPIETVVTMPVSSVLGKLDVSSAAKIVSNETLVCQELELEGSSAAHLDLRVEARKLELELNSAAGAKIAFVGSEVDVEMNSAAKCEMTGATERLDVDINSAARFTGFELLSRTADVDASSAGSVELSVAEDFSVDVSSGASVRYKGLPARIHQDVSSGGSLRNVQ